MYRERCREMETEIFGCTVHIPAYVHIQYTFTQTYFTHIHTSMHTHARAHTALASLCMYNVFVCMSVAWAFVRSPQKEAPGE